MKIGRNGGSINKLEVVWYTVHLVSNLHKSFSPNFLDSDTMYHILQHDYKFVWIIIINVNR